MCIRIRTRAHEILQCLLTTRVMPESMHVRFILDISTADGNYDIRLRAIPTFYWKLYAQRHYNIIIVTMIIFSSSSVRTEPTPLLYTNCALELSIKTPLVSVGVIERTNIFLTWTTKCIRSGLGSYFILFHAQLDDSSQAKS